MLPLEGLRIIAVEVYGAGPYGTAHLGDLGAEVFHRLVKTAAGLVGNLRGNQPERLGLTYEHLKAVNPKIVCAHLSADGRDGIRPPDRHPLGAGNGRRARRL
jgi:succinate---hydroxymethylglutarate CoA-transferase